VLIITLLLIGGALKEVLVFAIVFAVANVALGIKYVAARPHSCDRCTRRNVYPARTIFIAQLCRNV
jgi:hypothetical protein